ncbi:MAG TPA: hypothetical protein VNN77_01905 [candidate division Zixibacteria bacterium]|nr:hypothetical protein [candidate division Zixibacteria bacterium]
MKSLLTTLFLLACGIAAPTRAEYTILLKNGRRIVVQSYREEGGMVRFPGLGGEIAIGRDQVEAIRKGAAPDAAFDVSRPAPPVTAPPAEPVPGAAPPAEKPAVPPATAEEQRAKEEKEYQARVKELTARLKELRERYAAVTRGNVGAEPSFFTTEEAFRGHQEDLLSRLRDAEHRSRGLETGGAAQSPPFTLDPVSPYSEGQKQLSDLRGQIAQLEAERDRLIAEMREKNFDTGSLFLD